MSKLAALILACLALGLVAGCGGDDDSGDSGSANNDTTEQTTTAEKPAGTDEDKAGKKASGGKAATAIEIVDIDYEPKSAKVKRGATVRWTNTGELPHTVTKSGGPGADFDSGTLEPGDTFEQTFADAGKIDYLCTIHSGQTGTLTVR